MEQLIFLNIDIDTLQSFSDRPKTILNEEIPLQMAIANNNKKNSRDRLNGEFIQTNPMVKG